MILNRNLHGCTFNHHGNKIIRYYPSPIVESLVKYVSTITYSVVSIRIIKL